MRNQHDSLRDGTPHTRRGFSYLKEHISAPSAVLLGLLTSLKRRSCERLPHERLHVLADRFAGRLAHSRVGVLEVHMEELCEQRRRDGGLAVGRLLISVRR